MQNEKSMENVNYFKGDNNNLFPVVDCELKNCSTDG